MLTWCFSSLSIKLLLGILEKLQIVLKLAPRLKDNLTPAWNSALRDRRKTPKLQFARSKNRIRSLERLEAMHHSREKLSYPKTVLCKLSKSPTDDDSNFYAKIAKVPICLKWTRGKQNRVLGQLVSG